METQDPRDTSIEAVLVSYDDPTVIQHDLRVFAMTLKILMASTKTVMVVADYVPNYENTPMFIILNALYNIQNYENHILADTLIMVCQQRDMVDPQFHELSRFPEYQKIAVDGYQLSYISKGKQHRAGILRAIPTMRIDTIRTKFALPRPIVGKDEFSNTDDIITINSGAYGVNADGTKPTLPRCGFCNFPPDSCPGHVRYMPLGRDIANPRLPAIVFNPILYAKDYTGTITAPERKHGLFQMVAHLFCWTRFQREYEEYGDGRLFFAPVLHPIKACRPGHMPDHLFTNQVCEDCLDRVKVGYVRLDNGKLVLESALYRKNKPVMLVIYIVQTSGDLFVITPQMYYMMMSIYHRLNPTAFAKIGYDPRTAVMTHLPILPPQNYLEETYTTRRDVSIEAPTRAIVRGVNTEGLDARMGVLYESLSQVFTGKEGIAASAATVPFMSAGRMTMVISAKQPINIGVVSQKYAQLITVHVPYTSSKQMQELIDNNMVQAYIDTRGIRHDAVEERVYLTPLQSYDKEVVTNHHVNTTRRYLARLPTHAIPQLRSRYKIEVPAPESVATIIRSVADGDRGFVIRNPTIAKGGIVALEFVVSESIRTVQIHPSIVAGLRGDYDGDEIAVSVPPFKKYQDMIYNDMGSEKLNIYGLHQDPIIALYVLSSHPDVYFRVPPTITTRLCNKFLSHTFTKVKFVIDQTKFKRHVPKDAYTYDKLVSKHNKEKPYALDDTGLYCRGADFIRMLFPVGMVSLDGVINLRSRNVALRPLTEEDVIMPRTHNICGHINKYYDATILNDFVSWSTYILNQILAYNTEIISLGTTTHCAPFVSDHPTEQVVDEATQLIEATSTNSEFAQKMLHSILRRHTTMGMTSHINYVRVMRMTEWIVAIEHSRVDELKSKFDMINKKITMYQGDVKDIMKYNPLYLMVQSGARGSMREFNRMFGFGEFAHEYRPMLAPTINLRNVYNIQFGPVAYSTTGYIAGGLGTGLTFEETCTLYIISVSQLMQTPLATGEAGSNAKAQSNFSSNLIRTEDGRLLTPGLFIGRIPSGDTQSLG